MLTDVAYNKTIINLIIIAFRAVILFLNCLTLSFCFNNLMKFKSVSMRCALDFSHINYGTLVTFQKINNTIFPFGNRILISGNALIITQHSDKFKGSFQLEVTQPLSVLISSQSTLNFLSEMHISAHSALGDLFAIHLSTSQLLELPKRRVTHWRERERGVGGEREKTRSFRISSNSVEEIEAPSAAYNLLYTPLQGVAQRL